MRSRASETKNRSLRSNEGVYSLSVKFAQWRRQGSVGGALRLSYFERVEEALD